MHGPRGIINVIKLYLNVVVIYRGDTASFNRSLKQAEHYRKERDAALICYSGILAADCSSKSDIYVCE